MPEQVRARISEIASDCEFGPDVLIEADEVRIGSGCRIGFSGDDDFRTPPAVRIRCERLELGSGVRIGRSVRLEGGRLALDEDVRVQRGTTVRVLDELHIGAHGTVHAECEISGRSVHIGQELWMLPGAKIGGGSAFEHSSRLDAGHYLHLGAQTFVNTARPVAIGHEVGLGTRTSIYTHGAYASRLMGFPVAFAGVSIGDFTWVPGAIINPGVRIGRNCVIGVNSLVTKEIPDGSLAAGSPATVIREGAYPRPLHGTALLDFYEAFLIDYAPIAGSDSRPQRNDSHGTVILDVGEEIYIAARDAESVAGLAADDRRRLILAAGSGRLELRGEWTLLDPEARYIYGAADHRSDRLTNELRRHGIRFYSRPDAGRYVQWEAEVPRHLDEGASGVGAAPTVAVD